METFTLYFKLGLNHVLDIHAYDHILFLLVLTLVYTFADWKKLLVLVSLFTLGHSLSLFVSVFEIYQAKIPLIELLIPITIGITALYNIFKPTKKNKSTHFLTPENMITVGFGLIHGFGFSFYFKNILPGNATDKILPLLQFALGIEAAQLCVVVAVLLLTLVATDWFKISKRDWILSISSLVLGIIIPMILERI